MVKFAKLFGLVSSLSVTAALMVGCSAGGSSAADNTVAATVNGRNILMKEVERAVNQRAGGRVTQLSPLELAQARLTVLDELIKREVLFQRAEREKLLPTEDQIDGVINQQKQQSGMTSEDFEKGLRQQNISMETLREEARKDLAISSLQEKYSGKISISDKEVEDFFNTNKQQFVARRGVALSMIMVDPLENQGISDDAKNETDAKAKIDGIYQRLQAKADFATVARATSEDINTVTRGGDIGFATEQDLRNNSFPPDLVARLFGPMQVGDYTEPIRFNSGKWYIFKLAEKRLETQNLTLESPGVRPQITQELTNRRREVVNAALLEVALNEARVVNNLATNMLNNPSNLGLRPAGSGAGAEPAAGQSPAATQPASTPANSPALSSPSGSPQ